MSDLCRLIWCAMVGLVRSRAALQAEILVLRHQLNVLRRKSPKRVAVSNIDRLLFAVLFRLSPKVIDALKILKPERALSGRIGAGNHSRAAAGQGRPRTSANSFAR
jgi:hypothetical protein